MNQRRFQEGDILIFSETLCVQTRDRKRRASPLAVVGCFLVLGLCACNQNQEMPLPEELVGTYETLDERYADRFLTLEDTAVVFGLGDGETERYRIKYVIRGEEDGRTTYMVEYLASYGRDRLTFYELNGALSFTNHPDIRWTKGEVR